MTKIFNRGVKINVNNESALNVNNAEVIDKDGKLLTAGIKDANVTLAKLASGITPSHVVKFFKLGSTITTTTLTGLAVGDLIVSILADGTVAVATCAVANTLPSDPADTTYLIVFRVAA